MSVTTMTIGELCVSPYNCRTNQHDANEIAGMAESLLKRGQLYPLVVHPMPAQESKKKQYGALAGGRRLRAFTLLITQGRLPSSHPIEVIVRDITDEGELRELSLAENIVRIDLRKYEIFAAVARANAKGRSLKDIAETNGQTIETVRMWARLGNLHPTIFSALEAGSISQDVASAYGATENQALQLKVYDQLSPMNSSSPTMVRKLLKVGDSDLTKVLLFVGEKAYGDAGGHYELDLFADQSDMRGIVQNEDILMHLAEEKLERARELLRVQVANHTPGRTLRFEANPPRDSHYGGVARDLEISVDPADIGEADDANHAAYVQDEMAELEKRAEMILNDASLDPAARVAAIAAIDLDYEPLEQELAAIDLRRCLDLPAGDVFATLEIEQDGSLEQRFWWASRKAKRDAEKPSTPAKPVSAGPIPKPVAAAAMREIMPKPRTGGLALDQSYGYGERQKADAAIKEKHGLTADGVQVMRELRREVLRCVLIDDAEQNGDIAHDYAIWSLLRFELTGGHGFELGARRLSAGYEPNAAWETVRPHVKRSIAGMRWEKELAALRDHSAFLIKDLLVAFQAFQLETSVWKNKAAAILTGLMLERSLEAPGYQVPLHDWLASGARLSDGDMCAYAEPTEELVDLLPKAQRIALAQPHVDKSALTAWTKLKAGDLTAPVTRALRQAKDWVHPLMRFAPPSATPIGDDMREAAE